MRDGRLHPDLYFSLISILPDIQAYLAVIQNEDFTFKHVVDYLSTVLNSTNSTPMGYIKMVLTMN